MTQPGNPELRPLTGVSLLVALTIVLFLQVSYCYADRMIIPVEPDVSVYEPGQKAIIAWNGTEEILILSTDVNGDADTFALEIMPLPANPKAIQKESFDTFEKIMSSIWEHTPATNTYGTLGGRGDSTVTVSVTFHEKIGAHDITVVTTNDSTQLTEWAKSFLQNNGIAKDLSMEKVEPVIRDYLDKGFRYFVFDLIEALPQQNSLEPLLYEFETSFAYYPLRISSLNPGTSKIILFLLTKDSVDELFCQPFKIAHYYNLYKMQPLDPIQFSLTPDELDRISSKIGGLFAGIAWLTALEYEGQMAALVSDFEIRSSAFLLSFLIRTAQATLIPSLIVSGLAILIYSNMGISVRRKYKTPMLTR